jgi:hypothetical protein
MKLKFNLKSLAVALMIAAAPLPMTAYAAPGNLSIVQKSFAAPEEAGKALADAVRAKDVEALLAVVGPKSRSWLFSGDKVADREAWDKFLLAYERKNSISQGADGRAMLMVGDGDWSFPAPLVKKDGSWIFDSAAGREEIINRRVGENELSAIQTLLATVDAQREYAAADLDGNGYNDYARRFISSAGAKDGLYWPATANQPLSPLGPLVGEAAREGYRHKGGQGKEPQPYHGYNFRMLTAQGVNAPGGAYSYLVNDRMIGGFAVVAYPAKYGVSGVMTFVVNHDGTVYQKNLGKNTKIEALRMRRFNPDSSWNEAK